MMVDDKSYQEQLYFVHIRAQLERIGRIIIWFFLWLQVIVEASDKMYGPFQKKWTIYNTDYAVDKVYKLLGESLHFLSCVDDTGVRDIGVRDTGVWDIGVRVIGVQDIGVRDIGNWWQLIVVSQCSTPYF